MSRLAFARAAEAIRSIRHAGGAVRVRRGEVRLVIPDGLDELVASDARRHPIELRVALVLEALAAGRELATVDGIAGRLGLRRDDVERDLITLQGRDLVVASRSGRGWCLTVDGAAIAGGLTA